MGLVESFQEEKTCGHNTNARGFTGELTEVLTPEKSAYERACWPKHFDVDGDRPIAHLSNPTRNEEESDDEHFDGKTTE